MNANPPGITAALATLRELEARTRGKPGDVFPSVASTYAHARLADIYANCGLPLVEALRELEPDQWPWPDNYADTMQVSLLVTVGNLRKLNAALALVASAVEESKP